MTEPAKKTRRLEPEALRVLGKDEYFAKMKEVVTPMVSIFAMYNSLVGGVVTEKELMSIPIHDHSIVRGHCCFDTCSVVKGRLYRADVHLDRHISSIQKARIPFPFKGTAEENKAQMLKVIAQTVVASKQRDASVRYWTSSGPGNFGVTPQGCTSAFYVVIYGSSMSTLFGSDGLGEGVREHTVSVPMKPPLLATTKTNNYLLNVLCSMESQDKGGRLGVLVDQNGDVAESCVMNTVFLTQDNRLITPLFDLILAGTTVRNVMRLAKTLVDEGVIAEVSQEKIPVAKAKESKEMFFVAGDFHLVPITGWDGKDIGDGKVGEVTRRINALLLQDAAEGEDDHYELSY